MTLILTQRLQAAPLKLIIPQCMTRVSRVTTPVLSSDVHYHRLWSLDLDLEGGNERVLRIDSDMIHRAVLLKPDCELQRHISGSRLLM